MKCDKLVLVSHHLCPYVQRAAISLTEKRVSFNRRDVNLANKPEWFLAVSPLGKTPVLLVDGKAIFESAAILEFLEETEPNPLHPSDPLERAEHRAWMEFGSSILNDIAGLYNAPDGASFDQKSKTLAAKFDHIDMRFSEGPYFAGEQFSLVDAVFGPVFRYFDIFDEIGDFGILAGKDSVSSWRRSLANRISVKQAVSVDYTDRLRVFLQGRGSHLTILLRGSNI